MFSVKIINIEEYSFKPTFHGFNLNRNIYYCLCIAERNGGQLFVPRIRVSISTIKLLHPLHCWLQYFCAATADSHWQLP